MFRKLIVLICFTWPISQYSNTFVWAEETVQEEKTELVKPDEEKKGEFKEFDQVVKGSQNYKGLFNLYLQKTSLYCEILPSQLNWPFLCMMSISRGIGMPRMPAGTTLDEWLLVWKRVGNYLHLVRQNIRFQAKRGTPIARAVDLAYNDSILFSLDIESIHPTRNSLLVDISPVFKPAQDHIVRHSIINSKAKLNKPNISKRVCYNLISCISR